jgi:hypothetical protein
MTWTVYEGDSGLESVRLVDGKPHAGEDRLTEALSHVGAVGWELVSTHAIREGWATYLFKRPIRED